MNIYPVNSNNNVSMRGKGNPNWFRRQMRRVEQKIFDMIPGCTTKEGKNSSKKWDKVSNFIGDPMWNRGIMGATALVTQPAIDYYNHGVDEETRTVSRNRTISKIVAGTLVGMFVVRGPVYKLVEKMTDINGKGKWSKKLLPKDLLENIAKNPKGLKNYRATIAMLLALGAMCFTNFLLDAPLTIFFTNYLNKKSAVKSGIDNKEGGTHE